MEAGYAREHISAKTERPATKKASLMIVLEPDAAPHTGLDSEIPTVDDACAGGIVRFSLGSDGH